MGKPLLGEEEKKAVLKVLESGMLAQGDEVRLFEEEFASFLGVKHAIATSNGTTALHAALLGHGIGEGDEVITTPFSFIATASPISAVRATPVFVDIDPETFCINPDSIESSITDRTKAIIPVHLFGKPVDMTSIMEIAQKYNLVVIEDAAQAHGAQHNGVYVGSFGTGCFSFYPTKNMTTGEGGMISTNNDQVAATIRKMINHGSEKKYHHSCIGHNFRMTNIAAAIGREQLRKLERFTIQRRKNAQFFSTHLHGTTITTPHEDKGHVFHQYTLRVSAEKRNIVLSHLKEKGIATSIFYPLPIHKQKAYNIHNHLYYPEAERAAKEVFSIPVHPGITEQERKYIVDSIKEVAK